jgi:hypothetical protein
LNPLILFFCEKRKSVGIMKKISCVDFLLKKRKEYFFVVFFFVKIIFCKKKRKTCQWWELCIKQWMLQKRSEVFVSGLRRINEWNRCEQLLMIACAMSVKIRELATSWDILLKVYEDHEKMWCEATWKKCGVEPRCGCESHIYMTWKVRQIRWHMRWNHNWFFEFSNSMNREEAVNGWRCYSLRVMKKCNDDMKTS